MENKINIAELLKDCPKGMELDCLMYDNVTFVSLESSIHNDYPIRIKTRSGFSTSLTEYGQNIKNEDAKCVIFPKGKTTWEGFQRPFKDGDIVTWKDRGSLVAFIYKERKDVAVVKHHFALYTGSLGIVTTGEISLVESEIVFATEEEKQKLFQAIKEHGYKWNTETKTLEKLIKPKFKVGDRIVKKNSVCVPIFITKVNDEFYYTQTESSVGFFRIQEQDDWELIHDKFDITTLVSFESRVLVRNAYGDLWKPAIFGCYMKDKPATYYALSGTCWRHCIPYENNEHLLGTTDNCDEFYKTWE